MLSTPDWFLYIWYFFYGTKFIPPYPALMEYHQKTVRLLDLFQIDILMEIPITIKCTLF